MNFYLLHAIKNMPQPLTKPAVTLAATAFCICTFTASGPMAHLWVLRPLRQAHGGGLEPTAPPSERAPSTRPPAPSPSRLGLGGVSWPHRLHWPPLFSCPGLPPRFMFWEALNCSMKLPICLFTVSLPRPLSRMSTSHLKGKPHLTPSGQVRSHLWNKRSL